MWTDECARRNSGKSEDSGCLGKGKREKAPGRTAPIAQRNMQIYTMIIVGNF